MVSVARVFGGQVPIGAEVTVRGWVRTRRDSKAGLSFIHVHDGSCFEPLQVVAPGDLPNYADRDRAARRPAARSRSTGTLVASQGKGQAVELSARRRRGRRLGRRSRDLSRSSRSGTRSSTCARSRTCARAPTRSAPSRACATACARRSTTSSTSDGFFWIHTPIITASDAEGAGEMFRVTTLDLANLPRDAGRQDRLHAGLLRQARRSSPSAAS